MSGGSAEMATSWSLPLTVSFGFLVVWCAFNRGSTKPIPRTGPSASGSIGGIRQFAFVDGKASASDTLRQAILDTLEFNDPLVDPLRHPPERRAQSPRVGIRSAGSLLDQGSVRRSCRFRTSRLRVGRDQHFQRRGSQSRCRAGCLRRRSRRRVGSSI
jgi:hypothetical protein